MGANGEHRLRATSLSHLALRSEHVPRMVEFYEDVLGLRVHEPLAQGGARLGWGSGHHVLDLLPGEVGLDHYALEVRDPGGPEAVARRLRAAGARAEHRPAEGAHPEALACRDPDGNLVELHGRVDRGGEHAADPGRRPVRMQHVTLATRAMDEMVAFYADGLGFEIADRMVAAQPSGGRRGGSADCSDQTETQPSGGRRGGSPDCSDQTETQPSGGRRGGSPDCTDQTETQPSGGRRGGSPDCSDQTETQPSGGRRGGSPDCTFTWLRCDPYHHTVAVVRSRGTGALDHYSYDVEGWADFKTWCDRLGAARVPVCWGPARHGPGNNLFIMFQDPDGNRIELSAEMERFWDRTAAYQPRVWDDDPWTINVWGGIGPEWRSA